MTAVENIKEMCEIHLSYNVSLWTTPSGGVNPAPPHDIMSKLCLAECGSAGICVNSQYCLQTCIFIMCMNINTTIIITIIIICNYIISGFIW